MTFLVSAIAFFVLLTGLILIHESGHFLAARRAGVIVDEFGFGLPPRAKKLFKWHGTLFSLNWILQTMVSYTTRILDGIPGMVG